MQIRDATQVDAAKGVRVTVRAVGISGADVHAWRGDISDQNYPMTLGHEISGVDDTGACVAVNPLIYCGECDACVVGQTNICQNRQVLGSGSVAGGLAGSVDVPRRNLMRVPDHLGFEQASLIDPLARGWHVARLARRAFPKGRTALVIGGGALGFAAALSLRTQGVDNTRLVEENAIRADYLKGKTDMPVTAPSDLPVQDAYDIVIDAVGSVASRALASLRVRAGGIIGHIGLGDVTGGFDMRRLTMNEVTIIGTYAYSALDFEQTAEAVFEGRLGALDWYEARPVTHAAAAFDDLNAGRVASPRVVLTL
ncbi:alcohol dehydrogenase catalytic domain-containing protein [Pseudooctadecabacter jejudonensis]|uniref:Putative L-galactonate oxidoreductase n=1 Tax=Pseudooctadecabacter jejudonensis TaxID=1391910 RepID=A0A1Y5RP60_9RHOB|nr:alcohol dehydrogenase catalytic domain-containing protein [Pseudooctadecabacter jejudonensis]SLN20928.1 Putative L-galactonate oxidoreductase [Pseudooctadecabacter jejudonensis]